MVFSKSTADKSKAKKSAVAQRSAASPAEAEALNASADKARRSLTALGEIVSIMMRTPEFANVTLKALRTIVTPALTSGQYLTLTARKKQTGALAPMGLAMWAMVSPTVDKRLSQAKGGAEGLRPDEWTSGAIPWLVVLCGDKAAVPLLVARLQQTTLKGKPIKVFAKDDNGKSVIRTLPVTN